MEKKKGLIRWIIDDFISDFEFVANVLKGKQELEFKYTWKEVIDIRPAIKKNWIFILLIILAFFAGYFYSAQHYQDVCNSIIIDIVDQVKANYGMDYNFAGVPNKMLNVTGYVS